VVIGYDTRFLSEAFAAQVARVLAGPRRQGASVRARYTDARGGLRDSAAAGGGRRDHHGGRRSAEYNGMKFSAGWGGPRSPGRREIQERANALLFGPRVEEVPSSDAEARGLIERIDPRRRVLERVRSLVNLEMIREARLKVVDRSALRLCSGLRGRVAGGSGCD